MNRWIAFALTAVLALTLVGGGQTKTLADDRLSIVATSFAPYDFARVIAGDAANVTMLLPPAAESHSYEPTPQDIIKIQNCDVFVYVGGDSDAWVDGVLASMDTSNMKIVTLMDCVEVVKEEIVEGMEEEGGHEHGEEEFDPSKVQERPMSDFDGAWISGIPLIQEGALDEYLQHAAEAAEVTFEEQKATTLARWASDYDTLAIGNNKLTINGVEAEYSGKGYSIVETDHGTSVWYQYQIIAPNPDLPTYLIFNDHKVASEEANEEADEEHEEIGHFHLRYGNESFETLLDSKDGATFYFDSSYTSAQIGEFMAGHEEESEYDEHVWTSPKNAKLIVQKILDALCEVDSANATIYTQNAEAYLAELDTLDQAFQAVVDSAARKTIVFGDRFPFRYFADAYGLQYFAAFPGCSTETEPSAATVAFLIDKVKAEQIPVVFHVELSSERMANTISEETGAKVLLFHACHNVSRDDFESGASYLSLMTRNVDALKEALN